MPERIQLRRTKGWRKPEGAVVVACPSRWGNPFRVDDKRVLCNGLELWAGCFSTHQQAVSHAVAAFRWQILNHPNVAGFTVDEVRRELAGHDLACWCALDQPCHADVLLDLANKPPTLTEVIDYLRRTDRATWWSGPTFRSPDGTRHCVLSHIAERWGMPTIDWFEERWSTSYVIGAVNDEPSARYPQNHPKDRVLAFLADLRAGRVDDTQTSMAKHDALEAGGA